MPGVRRIASLAREQGTGDQPSHIQGSVFAPGQASSLPSHRVKPARCRRAAQARSSSVDSALHHPTHPMHLHAPHKPKAGRVHPTVHRESHCRWPPNLESQKAAKEGIHCLGGGGLSGSMLQTHDLRAELARITCLSASD